MVKQLWTSTGAYTIETTKVIGWGVSGIIFVFVTLSLCIGGWSMEEEQRLVEAMKHYWSGEEGDEDLPLHSVTWQSVAEKVSTRNADQCR